MVFSFQKLHCTGRLRQLEGSIFTNTVNQSSGHAYSHVLFALCRPFLTLESNLGTSTRSCGFWTKHSLDMTIRYFDPK